MLRENKMQNQLKNSDFAVLYRTNAQSRAIEDALRKRDIKYRIYGFIVSPKHNLKERYRPKLYKLMSKPIHFPIIF